MIEVSVNKKLMILSRKRNVVDETNIGTNRFTFLTLMLILLDIVFESIEIHLMFRLQDDYRNEMAEEFGSTVEEFVKSN